MVYVIGIIIVIALVLFVPPIVLILGGIILLFIPGLEIVEITAIVLGAIKLFVSKGS